MRGGTIDHSLNRVSLNRVRSNGFRSTGDESAKFAIDLTLKS